MISDPTGPISLDAQFAASVFSNPVRSLAMAISADLSFEEFSDIDGQTIWELLLDADRFSMVDEAAADLVDRAIFSHGYEAVLRFLSESIPL